MAGAADIFYEVERLLDKRIVKNTVEYLVRWKNFPSEWDSWEPADNLGNCKSKITAFEKLYHKEKETARKHALKLVNKSKMARLDPRKVKSMEIRKKQRQKNLKTKTNSKKSTNENVSLDDIFESVIKDKTLSTDKSKSLKEKIKGIRAKKVVDRRFKSGFRIIGKPSLDLKKGAIKKTLTKPGGKAKPSRNNIKTTTKLVNKKLKLDNSPKSDKNKGSPKKAGNKRWKAVDAEISFSGEEDAADSSPGITSAKKSKVGLDKSNKSVKKSSGSPFVEKLAKARKVSDSRQAKNHKNSGKVSHSPNSAFKPVLNRKNSLKISVNSLVSPSKKLDFNSSIQSDSKNKKVTNDKGRKRKLGVFVPKNKNKEEVKVTILTDDESDDDILYSLSDSKSFTVNNVDSSHDDSVHFKTDLSNKSKVSSDGKESKATKKKSKLLLEEVNKSKQTRKIQLIDSIKQISASAFDKFVRPVSPTPVYTTVKHNSIDGTLPPDTQPLLAQPQWVINDDATPNKAQSASLPISPASMSYQDLLKNLPHQLHPKNKKKTSTSEEANDIERRLSVRATECAFKYKYIVIKKCQKYTQIWLNTHTKMKNALNPSVMEEISSALNASKYDDSTLVMFSGLGNVFCSGIDLHYLTVGDRKIAARKMADALRDLVRKFITFPKLLIAVVTGPAIGLGSALLPLCDIVYASDKATFYMPYAQLSQTPEGCSSYTLPHIVGPAMANELLIGGRKLTAIEACQLGFISQVYWPTSMMQEVIPRVQHMALLSGKVLETTKLLMQTHTRTKLELTNESEYNLLMERWASTECQKAVEEFLSNEKNYTL
ncbi:Chromodomain Y-like protein 2 [Mactra antiquata]